MPIKAGIDVSEDREWGVGSVFVGSAFGAPQISAPNRSETLRNKGFGGLSTKNWHTPKTQIQRPRIQRPILGPLNVRIPEKKNMIWGNEESARSFPA